jgi:hypothetical protein
MAVSTALLRVVTREEPPGRLAVMRVGVGVLALVAGVESVPRLAGILAHAGSAPVPWPWSPALTAHADAVAAVTTVAWFSGALALVLGVAVRAAGGLTLAAIGLAMATDRVFLGNALYLVALEVLLVTVARTDGAWTLLRRPARVRMVPAWPVVLFAALVPVVYLSTALAKLTHDWRSGWLVWVYVWRDAPVPTPAWWETRAPATIHVAVAYTMLATEVFLGVGLVARQTRALAVIVGVALHVGVLAVMPLSWIGVLQFTQIGGAMLVCYLAYAEIRPDGRLALLRPSS